MGREATKASENVYYKARKMKAEHDERYSSRDGAAELMGVHPSTLAGYELDTVKCPTPDMVVLMADMYKAPELMNHYCSNECPIGKGRILEVSICELDRLTIKAMSSLKEAEEIRDGILEIAEDGQVTDEEWTQLEEILEKLKEISKVGQELELYIQKYRS